MAILPATTVEVAKALGLSRQRVLALTRQGRIPGARKTSWCWLYTPPFVITPAVRGPRKRKRKT
jgi:hypothetical protein